MPRQPHRQPQMSPRDLARLQSYAERTVMVVGMAELPNGDWTNAEGADLAPTCFDVCVQASPARRGLGDFDMIDFGSFTERNAAVQVARMIAESLTGEPTEFDIL